MGEQKRFRNLPPDIRAEMQRQKADEQSAPVKLLEERIEQASDAVLHLFVVATAEAANDEEKADSVRAAAVAMATLRQMFASITQIIPGPPRALIADAITKTIEMSAPQYEQTLHAAMPAGHARRKRLLEVGPEQFERENEEARQRAEVEAQRLLNTPFATANAAAEALERAQDAFGSNPLTQPVPTHMTLGEAERASSGEGENNG